VPLRQEHRISDGLKKTGKFPSDWNTEPSLVFPLGAAELIDRQSWNYWVSWTIAARALTKE
jgi:hypothetical protein